MKNKTIMCITAALLLSGCGREVALNERESLPDAVTELDNSSVLDAVTMLDDSSHKSDDSVSATVDAVTELSSSSLDSSSAAEKKSSKKKKKSDSSSEDPSSDDSSSKAPVNRSAEIKLVSEDTLEVYSKVKMSDLITRSNAELLEPDALVDTKELGEHEATVKLKYDGEGYSATVKYEVKDTKPPVVLNSGDGAIVAPGSTFDLESYVGYADNYDRSPKLTYTGTVDTSTLGDYPLTATLSDSNGNVYSWDLTVSVSYDQPAEVSSSDSMSWEDFKLTYGGDNVALGLDVSQWQGDIDFEAVKNAGCEFVIIRIGFGSDTEMTIDPKYQQNIDGATAAGIPVGIYFYSEDSSSEAVRDHAKWIAGLLAGRKLDFPIAFDWEDFDNFQEYGMSIDDLNELFEEFSDELSLYGYDTMLYSSKNFLEYFWTNEYHRTVWLAHYVDQTDYAGEYAGWQRCYGKIDGIDNDADFNVWYEPFASGTDNY